MTPYILAGWLLAACIGTPIIGFHLRKLRRKHYPLAR